MPFGPPSGPAEAAAFGQNVGNTVNSMMFALPQLRIQQERLRQQAALQQAQAILYQLQGKESVARAGLHDAQTDKAKEEAGLLSLRQSVPQRFGEAFGRQSMPPVRAPYQPALEVANPGLPGTLVPYDAIGQQQTSDNLADVTRLAAVVAALNGKPQGAAEFQTKNMANQQIAPILTPSMAMSLLGVKPTVMPQQSGLVDQTGRMTQMMPQHLAAGMTQTPGMTDVPLYTAPGQPHTENYMPPNVVAERNRLDALGRLASNPDNMETQVPAMAALQDYARTNTWDQASSPMTAPTSGAKTLTPQIAAEYLKRLGNRAAAEAQARKDGYTW